MTEKSSPVVQGWDCVVHVLHLVLQILNTSATLHLTTACRSGYKVIILSTSTISLKRSRPLNPTTLPPLTEAEN